MKHDDADSKNIFINPGVAGTDLLSLFIRSGAVRARVLSKFLEGETGKTSQQRKEILASRAGEILHSNPQAQQRFLVKYAQDSRTWLSLKMGQLPANLPNLDDPLELLSTMGDEKWYGPLRSDDSNTCFMFRPHVFKYHAKESPSAGAPGGEVARWLVIAELHEDHIALMWDGFSVRNAVGGVSQTQFPYWKNIPVMFDELEQIIGGHWENPPLFDLILTNLWEDFYENPQASWKHLRIRAESSGVILNASSGTGMASDVDIKGLSALTHALAVAAAKRMQIRAPSEIKNVEQALTRVLIHNWGTLSYEFEMRADEFISEILGADALRLHCYFGNRLPGFGVDSLQHIHCYGISGGSRKMSACATELLRRYGLHRIP